MLRLLQTTIFACVFLLVPSINFAANNYVSSRIILGTYNKISGKPGTQNIPWTYIKTSHVTVDDHRNIYVLDRDAKRVLFYSDQGALLRELNLSGIDFSDKSDELGDDGYIQYQLEVSADGKLLYVTEGGKENNWAVLDTSGKIIKKNIPLNWINRQCGDRFRSDNGAIEADSKLNIIKKLNLKSKKQQKRRIDSQDNVYYLDARSETSDKVLLTKTDVNGKQMYTKEINSSSKSAGFIGFDADNNVYMSLDRRICVVSNDGLVQTEIPISDEPFFKGWLKWIVLCDGTLVAIPDYSALWHGNKGATITGDYPIYFFEKKNL